MIAKQCNIRCKWNNFRLDTLHKDCQKSGYLPFTSSSIILKKNFNQKLLTLNFVVQAGGMT